MQTFCKDELARGRSPATVHATHRTLRTALGCALREGLVSRNIAALAKPPRVVRRQVAIRDAEQLQLFLGAAKRESIRYPLFLVAIGTGMRLGELLGLRWPDIDWAARCLRVRQTFYRLGREWLWKGQKN